MSELLVKAFKDKANESIINIQRNQSCLNYVGFQVLQLNTENSHELNSGEDELCIVILEGKVSIKAGDEEFAHLGQRASVFDQIPTDALYVPAGITVHITAETIAEIALCKAPHQGINQKVLWIHPEDVEVLERGEGTNKRFIHNIMMANAEADSLLITEVYTPGGHWSSYPPHKHDTDNLPEESFLEETYYHRLNPPQGYALQRVYTDDRSIDEAICVENGDTVMVPRGYHPVGAPHGYDLYYLNVMAGPKRQWKFKNDPAHEWMLNT